MKNRDACKTNLAVYQCPSDGDVQIDFEPLLDARYSRGNYAANYGSGNFQNDERSNAGPRSLHQGGAMLLFCDGSARFVSDQINLDVLVAQFTSMNSETIEE